MFEMGKRKNSQSNRVKANHSRMRALTEGIRMRRLESICARMTEEHSEPLEKYGLFFPSLLVWQHSEFSHTCICMNGMKKHNSGGTCSAAG